MKKALTLQRGASGIVNGVVTSWRCLCTGVVLVSNWDGLLNGVWTAATEAMMGVRGCRLGTRRSLARKCGAAT